MRLSQLTRRMDRDDEIRVCDYFAPCGRNPLYEGRVRGIKRDDPINGMPVSHVYACEDTIVVEIAERRKMMKEGEKQCRNGHKNRGMQK